MEGFFSLTHLLLVGIVAVLGYLAVKIVRKNLEGLTHRDTPRGPREPTTVVRAVL